jgi:hypothetical protein
MFRDRVKEMAVNHPDMKAAEILANVEMLMGNPGPLGLKDESLMRYNPYAFKKELIIRKAFHSCSSSKNCFRYVQRVRSKRAKGVMGSKKSAVANCRKKVYRWGMSGVIGFSEANDSKSLDSDLNHVMDIHHCLENNGACNEEDTNIFSGSNSEVCELTQF